MVSSTCESQATTPTCAWFQIVLKFVSMGVIIYAGSRGCSSHIHKIGTLWAGKQNDFHQDRRKNICLSENVVSQTSHGPMVYHIIFPCQPSAINKHCQSQSSTALESPQTHHGPAMDLACPRSAVPPPRFLPCSGKHLSFLVSSMYVYM